MNFVSAIKSCLGQYASFSGKASRSEFWWFQLFMTLVMIFLAILMGSGIVGDMVPVIAFLALCLPSLAVSARRLHDVGRSGWWLLLHLTGIGDILLLYWWVQSSKE